MAKLSGAAAYRKGAAYENEVKKELERHGYVVVRTAGSHSETDLWASKVWFCNGRSYTILLFVQCKIGNYIRPSEKLALKEKARKAGAFAILAGKNRDSKTVYTCFTWFGELNFDPELTFSSEVEASIHSLTIKPKVEENSVSNETQP